MGRRNKSITIKVSEEERATLFKLAMETDTTVSRHVRQKLFRDAVLPTHVTAEDTPPKRES